MSSPNPVEPTGHTHTGCCDEHTKVAVDMMHFLFPPRTRRAFIGTLMGLALLGKEALAAVTVKEGPCGPPPPPKPAQASSAEGTGPLPLPAAPQRRTEKKNPPRPPVIAVKIKTEKLEDWATDVNDLNNLLIWMKANLGVNFTYDEKKLEEIDLEGQQVPVLYRTGHNAFSFTDTQRSRLREYILRGGMMIFDACCGHKEFADSARREIKAILPDHPLKPVGLDHAIFNCYYQNAGFVRFTPISHLTSPGPCGVEGVEIACRMAVVFSPHDQSCGWDMHTHLIEGNTYIESEDGLKIGANYVAYATATRDMSVNAADAKAYKDASPTKADKFRIGQIVHEGDWNPDPVGLRNLLDTVAATTTLKLSFETDPIEVDPAKLSKYPFVYMTGHEDFVWNDAQVAAMRQYLQNGGFLFADACCGRQKFDMAFRREMAKVLGDNAKLEKLPVTHPIYAIQNSVKTVQVTQAANMRNAGKDSTTPSLEGAAVNGRMAVIYSPLALNVGWRLKNVPYAVGYAPKSALDLGVNTVMYALTQ